jgi:hypothetical protein
VTAACRAGKGDLILFATDAAQAGDLTEVRRALRDGRALPWATKERLGDVLSRRDVGVVAVTDTRFAGALKESWLVAAALAAPPSYAPPSSAAATSILASGAARLRDAERAPMSGSRPDGRDALDRNSLGKRGRGPRDEGSSSGGVE